MIIRSTPLHYAAANNHLYIVEYLVNKSADINAITKTAECLIVFLLLFIVLLLMAIIVLSNI